MTLATRHYHPNPVGQTFLSVIEWLSEGHSCPSEAIRKGAADHVMDPPPNPENPPAGQPTATIYNSAMNTPPPEHPQVLSYATPAPTEFYRDIDHLNILGICHYVWGGLIMLFGCVGLIYLGIGIMFLSGAMSNLPSPNNVKGAPPPPAAMGWMFVILGAGFIIFFWTLGFLSVYAGYSLRARRRKTFCMIVAGFNCLSVPLGTILGVFTFIVLGRPTMHGLFAPRGNAPLLAAAPTRP